MLTRLSRDDGSVLLLVIGYAAILSVLITLGVDASKVFLARRALSSAADEAALAGAQAIDRAAVYSGAGGACGQTLPVAGADADRQVRSVLDSESDDLRRTFTQLDAPATVVQDGRVTVRLSARVAVPFGHVLAVLLPGHGDGLVGVTATATAESPVRC